VFYGKYCHSLFQVYHSYSPFLGRNMEPPNTARRTFAARIATTKAVPSYTRQERKGMAPRFKMNPLILKLPADLQLPRRHPTLRVLLDPCSQLRNHRLHHPNLCSERVVKTKERNAPIVWTPRLCPQLPAGQTRRLLHKCQGIVDKARLEADLQSVHRSQLLHHPVAMLKTLYMRKALL